MLACGKQNEWENRKRGACINLYWRSNQEAEEPGKRKVDKIKKSKEFGKVRTKFCEWVSCEEEYGVPKLYGTRVGVCSHVRFGGTKDEEMEGAGKRQVW